jgi:hypothetical protein
MPGTILSYRISAAALQSLLAEGAALAPIPQGNFPTPFPGAQLAIPVLLFSRFDGFRHLGAITVSPYP